MESRDRSRSINVERTDTENCANDTRAVANASHRLSRVIAFFLFLSLSLFLFFFLTRLFPREQKSVIQEFAYLRWARACGGAATITAAADEDDDDDKSSAWLYIFANSAVTLSRRFARHLTAYGDTRNSRNYIYAPFVEWRACQNRARRALSPGRPLSK